MIMPMVSHKTFATISLKLNFLIMLKPGQNKRGQINFQLHRCSWNFFRTFLFCDGLRYHFSLSHPPLFENQHTPLISLTGHFALRHPDTYQFLDKTFSGQVYQKYRVWLLGLWSSHPRALWPDLAPIQSFWVSSDLDCSLYRWRLYVYFTFSST